MQPKQSKDGRLKPALRAVETIVVPDAQHGRILVLRDTEGVTSSHACLPPQLVPVVARFTGEKTVTQIAREASSELGFEVPVDMVVRLVEELDRALFLEGPTYRAARAKIERDFVTAGVRKASHAGGAYAKDPAELTRYLDDRCLANANAAGGSGRIVGLVAPHIDPWRGAVGYGHAYGALGRSLAPEVDTFVLFGTSHAPMRQPFALCDKAFDTPLGPMEADSDALSAVAKRCTFDAYADQFNHAREHSLEFQVVFLKHLLADRPARIIPVLAGLGAQQVSGASPRDDKHAGQFFDAIGEVIAARPGRVVVVAGADMAHVGPRFGDTKAFDAAARARLAKTDRASLAHAADRDADAFWEDVARDLDTRRVCGLAPIYSLLRTLEGGGSEARAELLHYEQTVDPDDGSIVSHAALAFFA
jgi:AmmeMemoRadiSam system protein B